MMSRIMLRRQGRGRVGPSALRRNATCIDPFLSGCNTAEGVGDDVEEAGDEVEDAID